ncbi:hypothetical protein FPQ18DRAFT_11827 [Pyronema domesticum]|uniref:Uncharacterized protein n=1 Tax=Pyronema omphalodes (strain CBS 100304) TaxID=1076935 RepID=U4LF74_PYROM|nr:hypothetical protein FPQ18DRAFT_11827 [Pyronema domesticum]CCX13596.1 Protein of unknown function [Pyronema omphalodes CBS 100304]
MIFFCPAFWLCEGIPDPLAEDILSLFSENSTRSGYWSGIRSALHFLRHRGLCIRWFNFVSFCTTSLQITDQKYSFSRFQLPRAALELDVELYNVVEFCLDLARLAGSGARLMAVPSLSRRRRRGDSGRYVSYLSKSAEGFAVIVLTWRLQNTLRLCMDLCVFRMALIDGAVYSMQPYAFFSFCVSGY